MFMPLTSIPIALKSWLASWTLWEIFNNALEGMHPTFKHVPPNEPRFYMQTVFNPSWAALIAAT